jgi:hypothetical protein
MEPDKHTYKLKWNISAYQKSQALLQNAKSEDNLRDLK